MDLPEYEEISEHIAGMDWDVYDEEKVLYGYEEAKEGISKLLGYYYFKCQRLKRKIMN